VSDYGFRVLNALLGSEFLPASLRTKVMRAAGFKMHRSACVWAGANFRSNKVTIGSGVFINVGFYHDGYEALSIGDRVRIGPYVRVITATHEIGPAEQRGPFDVVGRPVEIKAGCWIGAGVTILPGVTIGKACVIAANSVVYEGTDEDGLYAGNPARRVRELGP
jgi:maltose O-acetyltransferase